ncbi:MAG: LPS export ABC transporter periplasmic protein LptC [Cryobacterium sp.]|nr:LPS export ABC transporter periplasmic protein LptC [Oligoflexia bacterium]
MGLIIFLQIVAFSPKRLEQETAPTEITADTLRPTYTDSFVEPTIPKDRVPEYTVEGFQTVSAQSGIKQWRIQAEHAYFYQTDGIVHAREVKSDLYDAQARITKVTSKEAKYFMTSKDLELFGDVRSRMPSGLETLGPYMRYDAATKDLHVPAAYPIEGNSFEEDPKKKVTESFDFKSQGLHYIGREDRADLLSHVVVHVKKVTPKGMEITTIESDRAVIDRKKDRIFFTMLDSRPDDQRYVNISQPGMTSQSRRAEFRINANPKKLRTILALDDVKIVENPKESELTASIAERRRARTEPRRATAGVAEFDSMENLIILRDYPQVYQDHDTITGDVIIVHRESDIVEIDQSNAFSEGKPSDKSL